MIAEDFFYWYGVGAFIIILPVIIWIASLLPALALALVSRVSQFLWRGMEDHWWESKSDYRQSSGLRKEIYKRTVTLDRYSHYYSRKCADVIGRGTETIKNIK